MKIILAGSASLKKEISSWIKFWSREGFKVLDYPKPIPKNNFEKIYPSIHKNFFKNIEKADFFFLVNENKKGIEGYVGAEGFAELAYAVARKIIHKQDLKILLAKMPSKGVQSYEEVMLWLRLGWIDGIFVKS